MLGCTVLTNQRGREPLCFMQCAARAFFIGKLRPVLEIPDAGRAETLSTREREGRRRTS